MQTELNLLLHRKFMNETSTEGNLYIQNEDGTYSWFCNTIEDRVRAAPGQWHKSLKVYSETAIPYGKYQVLVTWSSRFKRTLTAILNVPDFEGIRMHNGTSEKSSAGCIILSYIDDDKNHKLVNDKRAMNDLCNIVEDFQERGKIWITIVDELPEDFRKSN